MIISVYLERQLAIGYFLLMVNYEGRSKSIGSFNLSDVNDLLNEAYLLIMEPHFRKFYQNIA